MVRLDLNPWQIGLGVIGADQQQALFCYALLESESNAIAGRLRLPGLDTQSNYQLDIIWPHNLDNYADSALDASNGSVFSGDALNQLGLQLPIMRPAELLILRVQKSSSAILTF